MLSRFKILKELDVLLTEHSGSCRNPFCKECEEIRELGIEYERITSTERESKGVPSNLKKALVRESKQRKKLQEVWLDKQKVTS